MFRRKQLVRTAALQLATLALLLNTLVPAGFMLHPTGGSMGLTFVLCPDQGVLPGFSVSDHHPTELEAGASADTCGFSLLTSPMLGNVSVSLAFRDLAVELLPLVRAGLVSQSSRSAVFARGPPAFS